MIFHADCLYGIYRVDSIKGNNITVTCRKCGITQTLTKQAFSLLCKTESQECECKSRLLRSDFDKSALSPSHKRVYGGKPAIVDFRIGKVNGVYTITNLEPYGKKGLRVYARCNICGSDIRVSRQQFYRYAESSQCLCNGKRVQRDRSEYSYYQSHYIRMAVSFRKRVHGLNESVEDLLNQLGKQPPECEVFTWGVRYNKYLKQLEYTPHLTTNAKDIIKQYPTNAYRIEYIRTHTDQFTTLESLRAYYKKTLSDSPYGFIHNDTLFKNKDQYIGFVKSGWRVVDYFERVNLKQPKYPIRFFECECTHCFKTHFFYAPSFLRNDVPECLHTKCQKLPNQYTSNKLKKEQSGRATYPLHCIDHNTVTGCIISKQERLDMVRPNLSLFSLSYGTPEFMEALVDLELSGDLELLNDYIDLDSILPNRSKKISNKCKGRMFVKEYPLYKTVWYNEDGTKRIRHFKKWKHGKRKIV